MPILVEVKTQSNVVTRVGQVLYRGVTPQRIRRTSVLSRSYCTLSPHPHMAAALPLAALIPKNQTLTIIRPDATLKHALEVLYGARITAVPVVDNKRVVGMLDVLDIVAFLAQLNKRNANLVCPFYYCGHRNF